MRLPFFTGQSSRCTFTGQQLRHPLITRVIRRIMLVHHPFLRPHRLPLCYVTRAFDNVERIGTFKTSELGENRGHCVPAISEAWGNKAAHDALYF